MKVLFATDGSDYAAKSAGLLAEMTAVQPMDLTVVTVTYDPEDPNADSVRPWYKEYSEQVAARVQQHYEGIRKLLDQGGNSIQLKHLHGNPPHEILDLARNDRPDLVVLGARGHSMLETLMLGSVSENVAFHAPCSVLILRCQSDEDGKCQTPRHITLCYDGSRRSEAAAAEMAQVKWPEAMETELLAVAQPIDSYMSEFAYIPADMPDTKQQTEAAIADLRRRLDGKLPNLSAVVETARHVGDAIVTRAKRDGSDLIVLGDSGHSPLGKLLLGSTTKYVLRHSHCSVWISRSPLAAESQEDAGTSDATASNA